MLKVKVSHTIIENPTLTNKAFYLYTYLRYHAKNKDAVFIYADELRRTIKWKKNDTIKKYLQELRNSNNKYIYYELPINDNGNEVMPKAQPIKIDFLQDYISPKYEMVDENILFKIQEISQLTEIKTKIDDEWVIKHVWDEKELATRIYYFHEKNYNKKDKYTLGASYEDIIQTVSCNNQLFNSINNMFEENNLITKIVSDKIENTNYRLKNKYIPINKTP